MKILHIGKFYSPIEGGIESINQVVVDSLRGSQQRIISFNNNNISVEEDIDTIPVVRAASPGVIASQPISWKYYKEIRRAIRIFQPDVIHFHYPNPLGALYLLFSINKKARLIVHWHSDIVAQRFMKPFVEPIENWLLKRTDKIIATSPTYIEASKNLIKHREKIKIIPCSIKETKFQLRDDDILKINQIKSRNQNKPIVFFVGRHVEYKGIYYLLEAEKKVKSDCVFIIAGSGPLTEELKRKYDSPRLHWVGRLSDNEMRQYMYAASVFAFPSITRNEAFGVALAEAMYCHCPAITFTIEGSGVNWVSINGTTGLEVENRNAEAFANAIDTILTDENMRKDFANNAYQRVRDKFTQNNVKPLYQELYKEFGL